MCTPFSLSRLLFSSCVRLCLLTCLFICLHLSMSLLLYCAKPLAGTRQAVSLSIWELPNSLTIQSRIHPFRLRRALFPTQVRFGWFHYLFIVFVVGVDSIVFSFRTNPPPLLNYFRKRPQQPNVTTLYFVRQVNRSWEGTLGNANRKGSRRHGERPQVLFVR